MQQHFEHIIEQSPGFFNFKLNNSINVQCIEYVNYNYKILYEFEIPYDIFQDYEFYSDRFLNIYNVSSDTRTLNKYFKQICKSIKLNASLEIVFVDFFNPEDIEYLHSNMINDNIDNISINLMSWSNYDCDDFLNSDIRNDEYLDYIDDIVQKTRWRKMCFGNVPHIILHEYKQGNLVYISTAFLFTIIILTILIIILMIWSFCFIAYCKYKKGKNKISNEKM